MTLFVWNDSYSVGVEEVDNQHKMLIKSLNELHEAMLSHKAKDVIGGILKGLTDYVGVHFSYEENLMKKHRFPGLKDHKSSHQAFTRRVAEFQNKFEEGSLMLSMEVMNFLRYWLQDHIKGADQQFGEFLKQKGVV